MSLQEENALLGAASNPHRDGDTAESDNGIVQGHAFSIL